MAIAVTSVKKRLLGLEGWLTKAALLPTPYMDTDIQSAITVATRQFEMDTQFDITKRQNYCIADGVYANTDGTSVDAAYKPNKEDPYNFYINDSMEFFRINLKRRPVTAIQRVSLAWNPSSTIFTFPSEWLRVDKYMGRFTIMPFSGSVQLLASGVAFNAILATMGGHDHLPAMINVDYQSGLPADWDSDSDWSPLARAIEEYAAYYVCLDLVELLPQGLKTSVIEADGASQSLDFSYLQAKRDALLQSVQKYQNIIRQQFNPIKLDML